MGWRLAAVALSVSAALGVSAAGSAQPVPSSSRALHWSGTGNRTLGTVKVTRDAAIRWTSGGRRFELTDRSRKLRISGRASSGQSFVARRTYRGVRVRAKGTWTLTLTPLPAPKPRHK
jgi:hypothetical protein